MLVLGTAQLGLLYGIANRMGQPAQAEATAIIREAWENGIIKFDTAQSYGVSEKVLGKALAELGISQKAQIITKLDPGLDHKNASVLSSALETSFKSLRVSNIYALLLHREEMLPLWGKGLGEIMYDFCLSGKVSYLGISVYSPHMAIKALNTDGIDIIQVPSNILDRRFENEGVFEIAKAKKKEVYIRSIFLQGLLLMETGAIPDRMSFAIPVIEKLESLSKEFGLTRHEITLGYIKSEMPTARVVFGAETKEQVTENLAAWQKNIPTFLSEKIRMTFSSVNKQILNPSLW